MPTRTSVREEVGDAADTIFLDHDPSDGAFDGDGNRPRAVFETGALV